jgi:hypothetical protein
VATYIGVGVKVAFSKMESGAGPEVKGRIVVVSVAVGRGVIVLRLMADVGVARADRIARVMPKPETTMIQMASNT